MKLLTSTPRPATQGERIFALEEARKADGERLDKIETTLGEIRDLLIRARGAKALIDGTLKYIGLAASIGAAGVAIWKFVLGH